MQVQASELKVGSVIVVGANKTATVEVITTKSGAIYANCPEYTAPFAFNYHDKVEVTYQPPDPVPEPLPEHPLWTDALVTRLKSYVENRYFLVFHGEDRVYGVDPRTPEYGSDGWPAFYLEEYDDARPDAHAIYDQKPEDFKVVLLKQVDKWEDKDPDWSEADPKLWAEVAEYEKKK